MQRLKITPELAPLSQLSISSDIFCAAYLNRSTSSMDHLRGIDKVTDTLRCHAGTIPGNGGGTLDGLELDSADLSRLLARHEQNQDEQNQICIKLERATSTIEHLLQFLRPDVGGQLRQWCNKARTYFKLDIYSITVDGRPFTPETHSEYFGDDLEALSLFPATSMDRSS